MHGVLVETEALKSTAKSRGVGVCAWMNIANAEASTMQLPRRPGARGCDIIKFFPSAFSDTLAGDLTRKFNSHVIIRVIR